MMGPLPLWAEVAWAAVEDGTDGTVVVDGVMLGIGLPGQVTEPITWTVEQGKAVKIDGGDDADRLRDGGRGRRERDHDRRVRLRRLRGRAVRHAVGEGPRRHRAPRARRQPQRLPGGQNVSVLHLDGVILDASMQVVDNGRWILRDGEWVL